MSKSVCTSEQIAELKTIVYKSHIDQKVVRIIADKMKTDLFRKLVFKKPKPEEVQIISIDKYFEPYVIVEGEYFIEYSKKWSQNVQVHETMLELTCYGERIKPLSLKDTLGTSCKIVKLIGEGRYRFESKTHLIFDSKWREVGLEKLPLVPFEDQPEKILRMTGQDCENNTMAIGKEIEILRSRIVCKPENILCVHDELFKVSDRALIYKPMYKVTVKNLKTKKEIAIIIDAITGKTKEKH